MPIESIYPLDVYVVIDNCYWERGHEPEVSSVHTYMDSAMREVLRLLTFYIRQKDFKEDSISFDTHTDGTISVSITAEDCNIEYLIQKGTLTA